MTHIISYNNIHIKIYISDSCLTIYDSYEIKDKELKKIFLEIIAEKCPRLVKKRTIKSLLNEWKVHNALYNHKLFMKRTKDVDFELKQNKFMTFLYWIFSKLLWE